MEKLLVTRMTHHDHKTQIHKLDSIWKNDCLCVRQREGRESKHNLNQSDE